MHHSPNKSFVQKYNTEFFKKIRTLGEDSIFLE